MTSKQRISITFVPAGQQAMHERLEREAGIADALRIDDSRFRLHPYLQTKTGGFVLVKMTKGV